MKALDLYCNSGGASRGLMNAGFTVTGVDSNPQPRYVGARFIKADALSLDVAFLKALTSYGPRHRANSARFSRICTMRAPKIILT